jgi:pyruvate carboxylase subunit B
MKDYFVPPESRMVSPLIPFSPMPGGALTANTMMMRDTGTLHLFPQVIKEMSEVVRRGGFGTAVTPVSQFYFQQAYLNVTAGRWEKLNPQYGNMVLGYFGRTPVAPDPEIVKLASKQLDKPVFTGNPLDLLDDDPVQVDTLLQENGLELSEENRFIAASCEEKGVDFLLGKAKLMIRKQSDAAPAPTSAPEAASQVAVSPVGPRSYTITVEGRAYQVQVAEGTGALQATPASSSPAVAPAVADTTTDVPAPTPGNIVHIKVAPGDLVEADQTLLVLEAMKMESEVKSPQAGTVQAVHVKAGDAVRTGDRLVSLAG